MLTNRRLIPAAALAVLTAIVITLLALAPWSNDSEAGGLISGDADCNQVVNAADALADLKEVADLEPTAPCVFLAGDVDCNDVVDVADVGAILYFGALG